MKVYAPGECLTSSLTGFDVPVPYIYQHSTYDACRFGFTYHCTCQYPSHAGVLSDDGSHPTPDQVLFDGFAHWSSTSFATPVAAGLVAAHMAANKEQDPRAACERLLTAKTEFAEVRGGANVQALRPPTWRAIPVV